MKEVQNVNLFKVDSVCTHEFPNRVQLIAKDYKFNLGDQVDLYKIKALDNYEAKAQKCDAQGKNCGAEIAGTWSTIYDQSLRFLLEDGSRLLANFRYNMHDEDAQAVQKIGGEGYLHPTEEFEAKSASSKCDETMVGFY